MSGYRRAKVTVDCFILETSHGVVYLSTNGGDFDFTDGLFGTLGVTQQPIPDCVTIEHLPDVPTFTDGDVVQYTERASSSLAGCVFVRRNGVWRDEAGDCEWDDRPVAADMRDGFVVRLTPEVTT